ncbi:MAG: YceI family protein [Dehalococcoidia bacterium]|nr:YceI family protein [Dehalococcoidia bacterium]
MFLLVAAVLLVTACRQESPATALPPSSGAATTPVAGPPGLATSPTPTPTATSLPQNATPKDQVTPTPGSQTSASKPGRIVLELATGTEARYRVKEQLARLNLPTDAVGATNRVEGKITLNANNAIVAAGSRLVVDLRTLQSDESRRDSYIRQTTIMAFLYPLAEFVPSKVMGLQSPLPTSGTATFQVVGDMTIHGVTKPLTWEVSASFGEQEINGQATTSFRFQDFNMTIPRVFSVLSVEDSIRLEIDFRFHRTDASL